MNSFLPFQSLISEPFISVNCQAMTRLTLMNHLLTNIIVFIVGSHLKSVSSNEDSLLSSQQHFRIFENALDNLTSYLYEYWQDIANFYFFLVLFCIKYILEFKKENCLLTCFLFNSRIKWSLLLYIIKLFVFLVSSS